MTHHAIQHVANVDILLWYRLCWAARFQLWRVCALGTQTAGGPITLYASRWPSRDLRPPLPALCYCPSKPRCENRCTKRRTNLKDKMLQAQVSTIMEGALG
jgi:hypothetical protein